MALNFLGINIGNTRTKVGAFVDGQVKKTLSSRSPDLEATDANIDQALRLIGSESDRCVMVASVEPETEQRVLELLTQRMGGDQVYRVEHDVDVPIGRQLDPESIVGVDRLLNAAAVYDVLKQACVVVDAGTAITVDLVDGAGTFHGGAITPGAQMMLDSLHRGTALLPELKLIKPDEPVGHNTAQAMLTGVYYGVRGMVRELTEQYAQEVGVFPVVVATGGDAEVLFEDYDLVERVVPDLTMMGMAVTLRAAIEAENEH